jgi:YidC/Oxa1 family membrane protein insertase
MSYLPYLLEALPSVRQPGKIVGPFADLMGKVYNLLFELLHSNTSAGSLGLAIIIFTLIVKLILFPLMVKQQKSSFKMQALQPELMKIRKKYEGKTDQMSQQRMAFEMQEFQKKNGVSMVSGCLPMLIQLPILYALFYLFQNAYVYVDVIGHNYTDIANAIVNIPVSLRMEVFQPFAREFANAYKNVAIIKDGIDMGQVNEVVMLVNYLKPDDWNVILQNLGDAGSSLVPLLATKSSIETFLTIPLVSKAGLHFPGIIIPIAAGITTWLQSKIMMMMNPQNSDTGNPAAAMTKSMLYTMPIMMGVFAINMPAGLGLYWTISNLFGILQQVILSKHYKKKFAEEAAQ